MELLESWKSTERIAFDDRGDFVTSHVQQNSVTAGQSD